MHYSDKAKLCASDSAVFFIASIVFELDRNPDIMQLADNNADLLQLLTVLSVVGKRDWANVGGDCDYVSLVRCVFLFVLY